MGPPFGGLLSALEGAAFSILALTGIVPADVDGACGAFAFLIERTLLGCTVDSDGGAPAAHAILHGVPAALLEALAAGLSGLFGIGPAHLDLALGAELILVVHTSDR